MATKIQQRNEVLNRRSAELYTIAADSGFKGCILKGQTINYLYGNLKGLRQSGDIDMWLDVNYHDVIRWARGFSKIREIDYHHVETDVFGDTTAEFHFRPSISRNLIRNFRLQEWFQNEGIDHVLYNEELRFSVPDYMYNVILILNHHFWHLMHEGVGLWQMMDLYFVLQAPHTAEEQKKISEIIRHFSLEDFAECCMWILQTVFSMDKEYMICKSDPHGGRALLDEILQSGNFGKYDKRLENSRRSSRFKLMITWTRHSFRLFWQYPKDVLWTPIGVLYISLWRRLKLKRIYG